MKHIDHKGEGGLGLWLLGLGFCNKHISFASELLPEAMFNKLHLMHNMLACHVSAVYQQYLLPYFVDILGCEVWKVLKLKLNAFYSVLTVSLVKTHILVIFCKPGPPDLLKPHGIIFSLKRLHW